MNKPTFVVACLLLASAMHAQTVWHVDAAAAPGGNGTLASPFRTIQKAISAAQYGHQVSLEAGLYLEQIDFLGKAITIKSKRGAATTIVDAQGLGPVCSLVSGEGYNSVLKGVTLQSGIGLSGSLGALTSPGGDGGAGGVHLDNSGVSLIECVVRFCTGGAGGDSGLVGVTAGSGGPGAIRVGSRPSLIMNCEFDQNQGGNGGVALAIGEGGSGGAGALDLSAALVTGCTITSNVAGDASLFSGGIGGPGGVLVRGGVGAQPLRACRIALNQGGLGSSGAAALGGPGGAILLGGTDITSCEIVLNAGGGTQSASGYDGIGGVVLAGGGLVNCTVANNAATLIGGVDTAVGSVVQNSIIYGNQAYQLTGAAMVSYSCVEGGYPGVANIPDDPMFVGPPIGDFHLLPYSPCINAGLLGAQLSEGVDVDLEPRVTRGSPDMGADESNLRVFLTQANGPGTGVVVHHHHLLPGSEYYTLFTVSPCSPTTGVPFMGVCFSSAADLFAQFNLPIGVGPSHFQATHDAWLWGPYSIPPVQMEFVAVEMLNGTPVDSSPPGLFVVQ